MSRIAQGMGLLAVSVLGIAGDMVVASPVSQQTIIQADHDQETVVWTATIPEGFPQNVYTWRLRRDGTYEEDGRDALNGKPIQRTLSGRWTVEGARMILRQDGIRFVFDGAVVGDYYSGILYLNERKMSRFCAAKGEAAPEHCDTEVASAFRSR